MITLNYRAIAITSLSVVVILTLSCMRSEEQNADSMNYDWVPKELYDSIVAMDAAWEDAYNNCKVSVMSELISEDLEFYHDQGGMITSKKILMDALEKNICGKVTRELKPGSIEVYAINGYGAVEMGMHGFHNKQEPDVQSHFAKFVHIWKRDHGKWRITRVISLH